MISVHGYMRRIYADGEYRNFYAHEGYHTKKEADERAHTLRTKYAELVRVVKMSDGKYFLYIAHH